MANKLTEETSPYLLQHRDNPVHWYPWGSEALERSRKEDKPIFLSIGYAACHWCHVMAHESFEDPNTAAVMNEHFVNIKVDREERPDLDNIYMNAVVAMTGQGGWPMSVFLTPEGRPFFGGTYFPPVQRYNMPSFREVLLSVAQAWARDRDSIESTGAQIYKHLETELSPKISETTLKPEILDQAAMALAQQYDWKNGGWGKAPKFPQPMTIEFLLLRAVRGDHLGRDIAFNALKTMSKGGMYDTIGGGFHRYSVDDLWLVPHFEKMLYDNAQLARVYLHAYLLSQDKVFLQICEETLDFILREMTHPEGGFYSSLDADSEGVEGIFYTWSLNDLKTKLPDPVLFSLLTAAYSVTEGGNFEGANILQRKVDDETLAEEFNLSVKEVRARLKSIRKVLLDARDGRVRPATDDKVLTSWNGLMLVSFAEAARYLKRDDYLIAAQRNARFLLHALQENGRLYRSWREGEARQLGYLEDYAALILGLLALYQSDLDPNWYQTAEELAMIMVSRFSDPNGGFFDTADDHETLIVRPKDIQDNATPSGNALAISALLTLSAYSGDGELRDTAERALGGSQAMIARYPTAFGQWSQALMIAQAPIKEIAILGSPDEDQTQALFARVWAQFRPYAVLAGSAHPPPPGSPALLHDRPQLESAPTAYVCENFVCLNPTRDPDVLSEQLSSE
jgi:uncharacterized protein YyaL (SSP411 family)